MIARARLTSILRIQPGEGQVVLLLLALSFCAGLARLFTLTASGTLFLVAYSVEGLPYVYIAIAGVVPTIGILYGRLETRLKLVPLLLLTLSGMAVVLLALWLTLVLTRARWPAFALAVWFEVVWVMTSLVLWGVAGRLLNVRQGKRLFGLISAADVVAATLGGFVTPLLAGMFGTASLLLGAVGALLVAVGLVRYIGRGFADSLRDQDEDAPQKRSTATVQPGNSSYIVLILAVAVVSNAGYYFIDNIFYGQVEARYADETQLAGFLGIFWAVVNLLTLVSNLGLVSPIITRYGLRAGLLILPILTLSTAALLLVSGTILLLPTLVFWLAVLNNLFDWTFRETVYKSSLLMLYQPLPVGQRFRVQTWVESIGQPVAQGCTGLALLGFQLVGFSIFGLSSVLLVFLGICTVLAHRLGAMYVPMVKQALARRRFGNASVSLIDADSLAIVRQSLNAPHPGPAMYALDMLEEQEHPALSDALRDAIVHASADVRHEALTRIERLGMGELVSDVKRRVVAETDVRVRGAAARTLAVLGDNQTRKLVSSYLDHPEPAIREGALVGLLRSRNEPEASIALDMLAGLIVSPDRDERVAMARVLGAVEDQGLDQFLLPLLEDSNREVRRAALEASGKVKSPWLWPKVVAALNDAEVRAEAAAALVAGDEAVAPELQAAMADPHLPRSTALRLLRVAGRLQSPAAIDLLKGHLTSRDPEHRHQTLLALVHQSYRVTETEVGLLREVLANEVGNAAWLLAAVTDLGKADELKLLVKALEEEVERSRERVFLLLACQYERREIMQVQDNLDRGPADKRAFALEVLDLLIARDLKPLVFPLVDELTTEQRLQRLDSVFPQERLDRESRLRQILASPSEESSSWIRVCAAHALASSDRTIVTALDEMSEAEARSGVLTDAADEIQPSAAPPLGATMLSTIEMVLILKTVSIFQGTPDWVLAEVAGCLDQLELQAGEPLFAKGDIGECMYIIVNGRVRVHDGDQVLNDLGAHDIVGEMAVLDATPRTASVTAIEETILLRLDQEALYELMSDHVEVMRGIIHILSSRLRDRMQDVTRLQAEVHALRGGSS